ncbi:MAG TPA: TRAP transporter large permease subunit [Candidatus Baltobacteraceae bacterium]
MTIKTLDRVAEAILVVALVGEIVIVVVNVLGRSFGQTGFLWTPEISQIALSTMTFIGGVVAYRRSQHAPVRAVLNLLPERGARFCYTLADVLIFAGALLAAITSYWLVEAGWAERTPILGIPVSTIGLPLALGMILLVIFALVRLYENAPMLALKTGVGVAVVLGVAYATQSLWQPLFAGDASVFTVLILFALGILSGLPVGFALLLAAAAYLWIADAAPMVTLTQNMVNGTSNYVLLAVPFFILAGLIMERGGISLRLVRFVHALVGHFRGGLLQVVVVSMYLVSGLSGSKAADVAAVGSVMRDMLDRQNYSRGEGAAVLAASAAMGETVPPSIAMLILGSITSLSIAALFSGGLIPAAVIGICLMILIYFRARSAKLPTTPRASLQTMAQSGLAAIPALLMPVILFGGIIYGIATPTEVSTFAVIYGLVLAVVVYRELPPRELLRTLIDSATLSGMVLFILATASAFSWMLTVASLPQRLVSLLHGFNDSSAIFMVGSVILLILTGSLLEGLPALNVLAPLLLPIAGEIGINELHYGIVLVIAMGIGAFMPPAGVGFYVCCAIQRTHVEEASRAMLPYLGVLVAGLLIVAFVPWFTLLLPRAVGLIH